MSNKESPQDIVRRGYDKMGQEYHRDRLKRTEVNHTFLNSIHHHLPKRGTVLDLGCGGGCPISKYFDEHGYAVTGVDISEQMIALAKEAIPNGVFMAEDMMEVDFHAESFDVIASFYAIIHLPREQHAELFRRLHRWLKPAGRCLLSLGGTDDQSRLVDNWRGVPMFCSHYDSTTTKDLLPNGGAGSRRIPDRPLGQ